MNIDIVILYTIVALFYVISPGPAIFLALVNGMSGNFKAVLLSSLGNISGLFLLSLVSIVGLGALITASAALFLVVKIIGAAYLMYLGIKQFRAAGVTKKASHVIVNKPNKSDIAYYLEGFFLAATNPKPILFFISIFPQFLNIESSLVPQFFTLTMIFMFISFVSLLTYGYLAKSTKSLFSNKEGMKWFHRITGGIFIGMGVGLLQLKDS